MNIYIALFLWGWEQGRGRGGGERKEGGMAKLKADAERLFLWTWQLFAGSGCWEHEHVKPTWNRATRYLVIFSILAPFPKRLEYCTGMFTL